MKVIKESDRKGLGTLKINLKKRDHNKNQRIDSKMFD
jgi:hypothetical protein